MLDLEMLSDQSQLHFDEYVVDGSDDELFASGYLRGHVDLVIGGALAQQESLELNDVVERITASVNTAIRNGELEQNDIQVVNRILNTLIESWR
jgi:hypothetical protein